MLSKFDKECVQKLLIFPIKASFEKSLLYESTFLCRRLTTLYFIVFFGEEKLKIVAEKHLKGVISLKPSPKCEGALRPRHEGLDRREKIR
jgi:hypothetical protein